MQLKGLKIKNYRKFKTKEIEFKPGLNIIFGENEAGKSTISKAIMTAFFADPTTRAKKFFSEVKNWDESEKTNSVSNLPKLELLFELSGKEYFLLKDFQKKEAVIESKDGSETYEGMSSFNTFIYKIFGFTSQDVYDSTGFIKHEQLINISRTNDFYSAVQNASNQIETKENIHQVLDGIEKESSEIQRGVKSLAKNPGPIKYGLQQKADLELKLNELIKRRERVNITLKNKNEASEKVEDLKEKIKKIENLLENNKKFEYAKSDIKLINQRLERIENDLTTIEGLDAQIATNTVKIENFNNIKKTNIDELILEVKKINEEIRLRGETIIELDYELKTISQKLLALKKDITVYIGLVFLVLGVVFSIAMKNFWIGIVPVLGGLFMIAWQVYMINFSKNIKKEKELKNKLENLNSIQQTSQDKLDLILEKYGFDSIEDIYSAKSTMMSYATNIQNLKKLKENVLNGRNIDELRKDQTKLFLKKKEIEVTELTSDVKNSKLISEEYQLKVRELEMLKEELDKQQKLLYLSEADIKAADVPEEEILEVKVKLEQTQKDLDYFQRKVKILEKIKEYITKASNDTLSMVSGVLKVDMEKYLPMITNNKYEKVKIDEKFNIQVYETTYKRWVKPENNLSSGAVDQIYFLIRLAFFKLLLKKGKLFLILDDPFVNYDSKRLENAMNILKEEQKDYQILLFTNNKDIQEGNMIRL